MKESPIDDDGIDTTGGVRPSNLSALTAVMIIAAVTTFGVEAGAQITELVVDDDDEEPAAAQEEDDDGADGEAEEFDEPIIMRPDIDSRAGGGGDNTTLEAKSKGGAMLVEAEIGGREVYLVVDTGATYTALTTEFARKAGVYPHRGAPEALVQTAGGPRRVTFGLIGELSLGDQRLQGVSYTVCDECGGPGLDGDRQVAGLLGRNVLDRYRVSVDATREEVELVRQDGFDDQSADIKPWLHVEFGTPEDTSSPPPMRIENRARRTIHEMGVEIRCVTVTGGDKTVQARTGRVRARSSHEMSIDDPIMGCRSIELDLDEGRW